MTDLHSRAITPRAFSTVASTTLFGALQVVGIEDLVGTSDITIRLGVQLD